MPRRDEDGATSAEYALLAFLIAAVIIVGARALGTSVSSLFDVVNGLWP